MDLGLNGKVAPVTGASQGIGLAIAKRLAAEGMAVAAALARFGRIDLVVNNAGATVRDHPNPLNPSGRAAARARFRAPRPAWPRGPRWRSPRPCG
jgi:NAD(P)-dependent dehydrogenase (short-subunit alcohol dehydrogenase family)